MGIEITYKVFSDGGGACIDVAPWPDAPGTVCMQTIGEHNQDFYGAFSVTLSPENARYLGTALLKCADDMEQEEHYHQPIRQPMKGRPM